MDPSIEDSPLRSTRKRQGSVASNNSNSAASEKDTVTTAAASAKEMQIRMPPSLTLSKIRSLKMQALFAAVKAKLEIGTVALANVYFERLCLGKFVLNFTLKAFTQDSFIHSVTNRFAQIAEWTNRIVDFLSPFACYLLRN